MCVIMVHVPSSNSQNPQMLPHISACHFYACLISTCLQTQRGLRSLQEKYKHLRLAHYSTGDPRMPDCVRRAKKLYGDMLKRSNVGVVGDPRITMKEMTITQSK